MDMVCPQTADEVLRGLVERYPELGVCESDVHAAALTITSAFRSGRKLLACGNGGSAADSEHVVGELAKSFRFKRPVDEDFRERYKKENGDDVPAWLEGALPAFSLVSQTSLSTAFSNDESAVGVFAQQVYAYGDEGDVLLAISTSGNSRNVVEAARVARALGMTSVALTGARSSELSRVADICIRVPRDEAFQVQELHLPVYHCLCAMAEADLFGEREG